MSIRGGSGKTPIKLPPLHNLKVRRPNSTNVHPCGAIMTSVLSCWASAGYNIAGCQALETSLRECMDVKKDKNAGKNTINYHLSRFFPKINGPKKRK